MTHASKRSHATSAARRARRYFLRGLANGVSVVWPVVSGLLALIVGLGLAVGAIEHWPVQDSIYFAFVSGLTIGYGDLAPKTLLTRVLAVAIGICGVLLTSILAGIAVKALSGPPEETGDGLPPERRDTDPPARAQ